MTKSTQNSNTNKNLLIFSWLKVSVRLGLPVASFVAGILVLHPSTYSLILPYEQIKALLINDLFGALAATALFIFLASCFQFVAHLPERFLKKKAALKIHGFFKKNNFFAGAFSRKFAAFLSGVWVGSWVFLESKDFLGIVIIFSLVLISLVSDWVSNKKIRDNENSIENSCLLVVVSFFVALPLCVSAVIGFNPFVEILL